MFIAALAAWICGSKVPARCVMRRLPSGTDLTRMRPNRYTFCVSHDGHELFLRMFGRLHADGSRVCRVLSQRRGRTAS